MLRLLLNTRSPSRLGRLVGLLVLSLLVAGLEAGPSARASDHADPIRLDRLEGGITDLFVFPARDMDRRIKKPATKDQAETIVPVSHAEANRLVIVFCVRRALTSSPPFEGLDQFEYKIHADLHSANESTFRDGDPNLARYGGTVQNPEGIEEDFTITIKLDNDAKRIKTDRDVLIKEAGEWKVPKAASGIQWYSGVRDDPFIFPQFFGTNVIAQVISIPLECFPGGQQDFLFWGTSHRHGKQIDHVGRSQRTQLPRFDFLNTIHPRDHERAIKAQRDDPGLIDDFLRVRIPPEFAIRTYDVHPDVMYYTRRREPKYPNGRQLEDDVADLTCKQGDCQLFELSQAHAKSASFPGGRPTKNDKEFSDTFPYLADPHPDSAPGKPPELTAKNQRLLILIGLAVAFIFLLPWGLYLWTVRRLRNTARELVALRNQPKPLAVPAFPHSGTGVLP